MKNKTTKALEKLSSTLLKSDENFFTNINSILDAMKPNVELAELFAWLKLATKLTDYLRHPKLKKQQGSNKPIGFGIHRFVCHIPLQKLLDDF